MTKYKREELNQMLDRVDRCLIKISEIRAENIILEDENDNLSEFLLDDGYTMDDVDNIARGSNIDIGGN